MTPVDLHPDELLDRARSGALTQADAKRLQAHVRECSACAMELAWLGDGLDDRAPSETDALRAQRVINAVWGPPGELTELAPAVPAPRRWATRSAPAIALGMLLTASVAAAAISDSGLHWVREQLAPLIGPPPSVAKAPEVATRKAAPRKRVASAAPAATREQSAQHLEAGPAPHHLEAPAPHVVGPLPGVLLQQARAARGQRDASRALATYDVLERLYPDSRETRSSRIAHAQLLLDAGNARAALTLYDRYLKTRADTPLAEEARLGRAYALERSGERARALVAWRELLAFHPDSIHAALAREHIRELNP